MPWLLLALACRNIEPAPEDVDGLAHWTWQNYDGADDEAIAGAVENVQAALEGDAITDPVDGTLTDLAPEDLALVGIDADPRLAAGMYMADVIGCPIDDLERLLYYLEQDELFAYDAYERTYTSDIDAYTARTTETLTWDVTLDGSTLGKHYTEHLAGGLRHIPDLGEASPHGATILARTVLTEPATFTQGTGSFDQDYQIEVYYERAPGEVVHLYSLWRQYDWGSGFDQDNEAAVRTNLNGLADWDRQVSDLCAAGRP